MMLFMWDYEPTKTFYLLKELMTKPLVLSLPDLNKLFIIETNVSMVGVGAVLIQDGHFIIYISKSLSLKQAMSIYEKTNTSYHACSHQIEALFVGKTF
jgi:hypothetical protein